MPKVSAAKLQEMDRIKAEMKTYLPPGTTVYTDLKHVSRSGMLRIIKVYINTPEGIRDISYHVATVLNTTLEPKYGGIKRTGCGMDMGFDLIYNLSYELYPNGYTCPGKNCESNDHYNGDKNYTPHHHNSGGYALKQRWL